MKKSKFISRGFFFLCLFLIILITNAEVTGKTSENEKNLIKPNSDDHSALQELQSQINKLKKFRARDKRKVDALERRIKSFQNFGIEEKIEMEIFVSNLLKASHVEKNIKMEAFVSNLFKTFRLEEKAEIQNLKSQIESLNKTLMFIGNELVTNHSEIQTLLGQQGFPGEKSENINKDYAKSCSEIDQLLTLPAKQKIYPNGRNESVVEVLCDFETDGGGWTMIQKRSSGPKDEFYRNWTEYEEGFGSLDSNFWIGLKTICDLTKDQDQELRVNLWDFWDDHVYAKYSNFSISNSSTFYELWTDGYSGTAGHSMPSTDYYTHKRIRFSTMDMDHSESPTGNCAQRHGGAWWYSSFCGYANLNGLYHKDGQVPSREYGMYWYHWIYSFHPLKQVEMKVRKHR